jgi:Zn-dependent M28 family amino/carboxypeptidase
VVGDRVTAVAAHLGCRVQADPEPLRNLFIRSDQYNFIKQGVPSLAMKVGFDPGSAEEQVFKQWLTDRYHAPSDDADQPVNLGAAAGFEEVMRGLTVQIANDLRRPAWKSGSFFRRFAEAAP